MIPTNLSPVSSPLPGVPLPRTPRPVRKARILVLAAVLGLAWLYAGSARADHRPHRDSALLVGAAVGAVVGLALADADRHRRPSKRHHVPHRHDRYCNHRPHHASWHSVHRPPVRVQHHYHYHKPHRPRVEHHEHYHSRPGYSRTGYRDDVKHSVSYGQPVSHRDSVRF